MTGILDGGLRFGLGLLLAVAGLATPGAASSPAAAARAPQVRGADAGARQSWSAPSALTFVRAGLIRFDAARPAFLAGAAPALAPAAAAVSSVPASAPAAFLPGAAPGAPSRAPPASV